MPTWATFTLKKFSWGFVYGSSVLMGHHLILIAHHHSCIPKEQYTQHSNNGQPAAFLVVDLRDNRIQEVPFKRSLFDYHKDYSLIKYNENQILKFGGSSEERGYYSGKNNMVMITIKSFERIWVLIYFWLINHSFSP